MFTLIKYALYVCIAVVIYYFVQDIKAAKPEQKIKQGVESVNNQIENSVNSIVSQLNSNIRQMSQEVVKMMKP